MKLLTIFLALVLAGCSTPDHPPVQFAPDQSPPPAWVPSPSASNFIPVGHTQLAPDGVNTMTYLGNGAWMSTLIYVVRPGMTTISQP